MLKIDRKRHGLNFPVIWFAEESDKAAGINTYHEATFEGKNATPFETLINDLTKEPEEIKNGFAKNCKYEVNRASREDVKAVIRESKDITDSDIDLFISFFDEFWKSKDVEYSGLESVRNDLKDYKNAGVLTMGHGIVNGDLAIYHTYIHDDNKTRLLHSVSLYRLKNDEDGKSRTLIGMANRYLHYMEMLHFKEMGLSTYDWGGAGKEKEVENITKFKEAFGGEHKTYYDFEEVKGLGAHMFKWLLAILDDGLNLS